MCGERAISTAHERPHNPRARRSQQPQPARVLPPPPLDGVEFAHTQANCCSIEVDHRSECSRIDRALITTSESFGKNVRSKVRAVD